MIPITDAAASLGLDRATIEKLIDDGLVTPEKRGSENYVSLAEVRAALADAPATPPEHTRTRRRRQNNDENENEKEV